MIIFDLDDTLIDTSGSVTPFKMKECLKKLIAVGLPIPDFAESYSKLLAINAISLKSTDAIKTFAAPYHPTSEQIAAAILELTSPLPPGFVVPTTRMPRKSWNFTDFPALWP